MSLFGKLFGKKPQIVTPPPAPVVAPKPPKPDRAAEFAADEARLDAAIAAADEAAMAALALASGSTKVRQRAAAAIHSPERIRDMIRAVRGKDNAVYRLLNEKRDALLEVERAAAALQEEITTVMAGIARHARLPYDAIYELTLVEHEKRWAPLAQQASTAQQAAVQSDLERARATVQVHKDAIAASEQAAAAAAAERTARLQAESEATLAAAAAADASATQRAAERAEQDARAVAQNEAMRDLVGLLRQMQSALERGSSARAARTREQLAPRLEAAAELQLPTWFQRQLGEADEQLAKLKDWLAFTVAPKRVELIDRMQSLVGAEIAPEQLAQHVRKLQDEWRTLHRGAGEDDSEDTARFKDLANQAYEPCKVHFAALAAQRAENRAQREAILVRLGEYAATLEAEAPNWRQVIHTMVEARREWRTHAPVDHDCAETLQASFKAALDAISAKLDAEHERNVAAKRARIAEAATLVALEDVREAIDRAKALQRDWKTIGIVPRELDNPLWEEFRLHCNAVFERSANEAAAFAEALAAAAARAEELISELTRMAALSGTELKEAMQGLDTLGQEFDGLELPRAQARDLHARFHRAVEACHDAVHNDRIRAVAAAWSALYEAAAQIRAYARARQDGADTQTLETLTAAVEGSLTVLAAAPRFARQAVEKQWSRVQAETAASDLAANEAELRLLCIRAEIAAGVDTPAEDSERRRDYQMRRLLESRNLGADVETAGLDELALEWVAVGAVTADSESALRQRFEQIRLAGSARRD